MKMNNSVILLMIIPLFGAGGCLLEKFFKRLPFAKIVSVAVLVCCLLLLVSLYPDVAQNRRVEYTVGGWNAAVGIHQAFDGLAWMSFAIVLSISFFALLFAIAENTYEGMFYFFYLISIAGMAGVILAADLFNLFVCFEILGIAVYILIAYFQKGHAVLASFKYLLISSLGMAFVLIGIFIIYQQTGSLSLLEARARLSVYGADPLKILLAVTALVTGIGVRTAFIPFHTWLPEAHAYAPHPVSAILSGIVIKISFLAIWRIVQVLDMLAIQELFLWIGAATALYAVICALAQTDYKQLLAWHSISQMGYILASFGAGTPLSMAASCTHIMNHALFKSLLFLCIGGVIHITRARNLKKIRNFSSPMPVLMMTFLIGAFSIAGFPPFNGFVSKKLIAYSVNDYPLVYYALWATSVGTVASFIKLSAIFRKTGQQRAMTSAPGRLPILAYVPLVMLATLCVLTGVFGGFMTRQIFSLLFGQPADFGYPLYSLTSLINTGVSAGLGIAAYLFIRSRPGRKITDWILGQHLSLNTSLGLLVGGFILLSVLTVR
jgi:formate hydrogenlyase subunit 3/multisubunit Na+/H+ antiporter MnhD subunit